MNVLVLGTSFLLPGNHNWAALTERHQVSFGGYDQWGQVLLAGGPAADEADALVWVAFAADLVPPEALPALAAAQGREAQAGLLEDLLAPVLAPLDAHLTRRPDQPLLVAFSAPQEGSPVLGARGVPAWDLVGQALEGALRARLGQNPNLYLLPLDRHLAREGLDACLDERNFYAARCRLSGKGLKVLATSLARLVERMQTAAKKVLLLDCDNTLWGGVVGEVGLGGLDLGQDGLGKAFQDFQAAAKALARQGIVLAIVSKNNLEDVWEVFDKHPGMVLTREDIVSHRINWTHKAQNIQELAQELDLGLDSFVFWDDNPVERESVRAYLPMVHTVEPPAEVYRWPRLLRDLPEFARFEITAEDRKKGEQYKSRARFKAAQNQQLDEAGFLKSIELRPSLVPIDQASVPRAAQLCAKTNQFNLRVERYSQADILALCEQDNSVAFLGHLRDRFGDHGNVGLVMAAPLDGETAFLNTFLLSCRVLGRHLEAWMLQQCSQSLRRKGIRWLLAEFRQEKRNQMAAQFLAQHGFVPLEQCPDEQRQMVARLGGQWQGQLYLADLHQLDIPFLDIYHANQA